MAMVRVLAPKLSDVDLKGGSPLEPWQVDAINKVQIYYEQASSERLMLTYAVSSFPKPSTETLVPSMARSIQQVCRADDVEAENMARGALCTKQGPHATAADGILSVSTFAWNYGQKSLWKGPSDNKKLCRLTRSILNGYDQAEPIQSRTCDLSDHDGSGLLVDRLLFGDGQARGVAVRFAWKLMTDWLESSEFFPSPAMERVFRSLLQVPAVFDTSKMFLSLDAQLVDCAVKQQIKAHIQQALNTIEWVNMMSSLYKGPHAEILFDYTSPNLRKQQGEELLSIMKNFLNAYDEHSGIKAYEMAAPTAKRRRSNRTRTDQNEEKEDSVRLNSKKIMALKNILSKISKEALTRWQLHLGQVGSFKYSALQDAAASMDSLWPGSQLPKERRPNDLEDMAREMAAKVVGLAPGKDQVLARAELYYNERLTPKQHEMMMHKGFEIYEAETLHITNLIEKVTIRPTNEMWLNYRQVIEHWDRSMEQVARKDMDPKEFEELKETVLTTSLMDAQILHAVQGFPKHFNLSLIPDLKAYYQHEMNQEVEAMEQSNTKFYEASLLKFQLELANDQKLIRLTNTGSAALADFLEWMELKSKIALQQEAAYHTRTYQSHFVPVLQVNGWTALPGEFAAARASDVPTKENFQKLPTGKNLLIIKADFNTPHSRDTMKISSWAASMATIVKTVGANNAVLVCALATRPKEDNLITDVLDNCICALMEVLWLLLCISAGWDPVGHGI